uniref:Uncharacterized protein n=1 Tax=Pristionchus pacificus TaxID=54126 RepID=A0A8R1ZAB5_PRIPA
MGNAIYTDQMVCHDSLETCRSHCDKSECVFVDKCNGAASKYVCMIIDPKFITMVMLISFFIVLCVCSSLVACYVCRAFRASFRNAERTDGDIIFNSHGKRIHHVQLPPAQKRYHR